MEWESERASEERWGEVEGAREIWGGRRKEGARRERRKTLPSEYLPYFFQEREREREREREKTEVSKEEEN